MLARVAADDSVADAPLTLVVTGTLWRTSWKYGARGYRRLFWDVGVVLANALAAAAAAAWSTDVLGGFVDASVARLLDRGDHLPFEEWPLAWRWCASGRQRRPRPRPRSRT